MRFANTSCVRAVLQPDRHLNSLSFWALACLLFCVLSACSPAKQQSRIGRNERAIIAGELDPGHPSVVDLAMGCTANLIGYRTVLTASHCVEDITDNNAEASFTYDNITYEPVAIVMHPEYNWPENDIAVLRLGATPPIQPTPISSTAPDLYSTVTIVGFGLYDANDSNSAGEKRYAEKTIVWMEETKLSYVGGSFDTANICYGDSGGPAFFVRNGQELQVGVHALTSGTDTTGDCSIYSQDERVDVHLEWIRSAAGDDVFIDDRPSPGPAVTDEPSDPVIDAALPDLATAPVPDAGINAIISYPPPVSSASGCHLAIPQDYTLLLLLALLAGKRRRSSTTHNC